MGRIHPKDWIEVYESHTPVEWFYQKSLAVIDPWGDDRDDIRAAMNTMAVMPPGDYDRTEAFADLVHYLKIDQPTETHGPAAMRQLLEG